METTEDEVSRGFVMGPFFTEAEVTKAVGTDRWSAIRRFVLVQSQQRKLRPIDDCREAQLNAGYTSTIRLELQDSDYLASMALSIASKLTDAAHRVDWGGKCLDLAKAYKQLPIHPDHRRLAVIFFRDLQRAGPGSM